MRTKSSLQNLPLITVYEHEDRREYDRISPPGMIGTLEFAARPSDAVTHHYIGLNLSQSGAAIVLVMRQQDLPAKTGKINIFVRRQAFHNLPFRIVWTRQLGEYLQLGLNFQGRLIPGLAFQEASRTNSNW